MALNVRIYRSTAATEDTAAAEGTAATGATTAAEATGETTSLAAAAGRERLAQEGAQESGEGERKREEVFV